MGSIVVEIDTRHGLARVHVHRTPGARAALLLGHGAGGGVEARDLAAARDVALECGLTVALVEQPYRVAGRRSPAPAAHLDAAWIEVVGSLAKRRLAGLALVVGGRSSGARVACRTAAATRALGVLCLAFPLVPPRRSGPPQSRQQELDAVDAPTLVVQGESDRFGVPLPAANRTVAIVRGDHALRSDLDGLRAAVRSWLTEVVSASDAGRRIRTSEG